MQVSINFIEIKSYCILFLFFLFLIISDLFILFIENMNLWTMNFTQGRNFLLCLSFI